MANFHGKFSRQIATANFCGKQPRQIPAANSHGKILRQIATANSRGKFLRQNFRICSVEDGGEYPLCRGALHLKIKRKQVTSNHCVRDG